MALEFNVFNILRGDTPEEVEQEQIAKNLKDTMAKLPPEELLKVQEEVFMENLARVEDVINAFVLTAKKADMGLNSVEDFKAVAKRVEKIVAFSDQYKKDSPEVKEHLKVYLVHVLELVIASFNSHK